MKTGDKVRIKSSGIIATITCVSIEVGSKILSLSKDGEKVWNGNFGTWDESQVELFNDGFKERYNFLKRIYYNELDRLISDLSTKVKLLSRANKNRIGIYCAAISEAKKELSNNKK